MVAGCLIGETLASGIWSLPPGTSLSSIGFLIGARSAGALAALAGLIALRRLAARTAVRFPDPRPRADQPVHRAQRQAALWLLVGSLSAGIALSAGASWAVFRSPYRRAATTALECEFKLTGVVTGVARPRAGGGYWLPVLALSMDGRAATGRLEVHWPSGPIHDVPDPAGAASATGAAQAVYSPPPMPGEIISWQGSLYLPERQLNPYEYDARRSLARRQVAARSRWSSGDGLSSMPLLWATPAMRLLFLPLRVAAWCRTRLQSRLAAELPADVYAVTSAFVLGDRDGLTGPLRQAFEASGSLHLAAVSGLHVGLMAAAVKSAWSRLPWGRGSERWVATAAVALFALLTGMAAPVTRAAVVLAAGTWPPAGRRHTSTNSLGVAALGLCLCNPLVAGDPSFQLSFAATLAITCCTGPAPPSGGGGRLRPIAIKVAGMLVASAAAQALTLPVVVHNFHRFCPWAPVNNLLMLPAGSLVITACLAAAILTLIWAGLLVAVAPVLSGLTRSLVLLGTILGRLPGSLLAPGHPGSFLLVAAMGGGLWAALSWSGGRASGLSASKPSLRHPAVSIAALSALLLLAPIAYHRPPRDLTICFFAVGQGDLALIRSGRAAALVDLGPPGPPGSSGQSALARQALPYLLATRVRPALIVVSHPHADHVGGLADVLAAWPSLPVYTRASLAEAVRRWLPDSTSASADQVVALVGATELTVPSSRRNQSLSPVPSDLILDLFWGGTDERDHLNELSVAVRAYQARGGDAVLFTGDAGLIAENDWERNWPAKLNATVLKVGHHGAAGSSGPTFLARVAPRVAVVSVGPNRYGHPAQAALQRLEKAVPLVLRTDTHGWIQITLGRQGPQVRHWAEPLPSRDGATR